MITVLRVVALLAATGFVVIGCWALIRPIDGLHRSQRVLLALAAVPSVITAMVLVIGGVARTLHPTALFVTAAAFGLVAVRRSGPPPWRWGVRWVGPAIRRLLRTVPRHPLIALLVVVVVLRLALQAVWAVAIPMWSWDSLQYHLPEPSTWVQQGHLGRAGFSAVGDGYPMGQEVLHAWTMTLLRSIWGTGLVVLWLVVLGAAAVYRLCRSFRCARPSAALAAAVFAATPALVLQIGTAYVDVGATAAVLAALALGLDASDAHRTTTDQARVALLCGSAACAGLAVAMKPSMAPVAIAWFACALGTESVIAPNEGSAVLVRRRWTISLTTLLVLGGTWYLANLISYGNPLYPVRLLGLDGVGSYREVVLNNQAPTSIRSAGALVQIWRSWSTDLHLHDIAYDQRLGGLGAVWVIVAVPCLVGFAWLTWVRERRALLVVALTALATTAITRSAWWSRYSLVMAGVGCVAIGVVIDRLRRGDAARSWRARPRVALAVVGVVVLTVLPVTYRSASSTAIQGVDDHGRSTTFGLRAAVHLVADGYPERHTWPWFASPDLQALPDGASIAYLDNGIVLPQVLIGMDLQHRVQRIAPQPTPEALLERLTQIGAEYFFLPTPPRAGSVEAIAMADQHVARPVRQRAFGGGALWELGSFRVCKAERIDARAQRTTRSGVVSIQGAFRDGCGPVANAAVEVWAGDRRGAVWSTARQVAWGTTDEHGRFQIRAGSKVLPKGALWFVRFVGRTGGPAARPPLASTPRTVR